jgi:regulatory protein
MRQKRRLTAEQIREYTLQRAIRLLAAKPRSVAELRQRLLQGRQASPEAVEIAIARLKEYGYLNDERFAFGYASLRVHQKPLGRQRLKQDLKTRQVGQAVVEEALDLVFAETSEEELIDRAIERRVRLKGQPKSRTETKSLFDYLLRQGFPFDLIVEKIRAVCSTELEESE